MLNSWATYIVTLCLRIQGILNRPRCVSLPNTWATCLSKIFCLFYIYVSVVNSSVCIVLFPVCFVYLICVLPICLHSLQQLRNEDISEAEATSLLLLLLLLCRAQQFLPFLSAFCCSCSLIHGQHTCDNPRCMTNKANVPTVSQPFLLHFIGNIFLDSEFIFYICLSLFLLQSLLDTPAISECNSRQNAVSPSNVQKSNRQGLRSPKPPRTSRLTS